MDALSFFGLVMTKKFSQSQGWLESRKYWWNLKKCWLQANPIDQSRLSSQVDFDNLREMLKMCIPILLEHEVKYMQLQIHTLMVLGHTSTGE